MNSSGQQGNARTFSSTISADGRYVAFDSAATNLVPGDTNDRIDAFVRDRKLNTTTRVSVSSTGAEANNDSFSPVISSDGRYVAFVSRASNLTSSAGGQQVFVRDLKLHKTTEVSVSRSGGPPNSISGMTAPAISADGRYIAFVSRASNLVRHDKNETWDVFVRDLKQGNTRVVSVSSDGRQGNGQSFSPSISADGRFVAFESRAGNLVRGDTNDNRDVFVRDRKRHTTKRVGVSSSGRQANGDTKTPAISANGRYVAFVSKASNLVHRDTNKATDIFVRDLQRSTTRRVNVSSSGRQGNGPSSTPSLSANGRYVGFSSQASNLVHRDTKRKNDVFVRDRKHHTTRRVSVSSSGQQGNGDSGLGVISANGGFMAFTSEASNLVPGDTNGSPDVFVRGPLR